MRKFVFIYCVASMTCLCLFAQNEYLTNKAESNKSSFENNSSQYVNGDIFESYSKQFGVTLSFKKSLIIDSEQMMYFTFGLRDESKIGMHFPCCNYVELDVNGLLFFANKPTTILSKNDLAWHPQNDDFLFQNCEIPYTSWYNYKDNGKAIKDRRRALRKYVEFYSNKTLFERSNADTVCVIRFPNLGKIVVSNPDNPNLNDYIHAYYDSCYALEFYSWKSLCMVTMLLFIHDRRHGKAIDDYVEQISHYVRFDLDFKFDDAK